MERKILVPALSEGDDKGQGTVVGIMVNIGDSVAVGDAIVEIETDKVTVEIPSTHAGEVTAIELAIGDEVSQGVECLTLSVSADAEITPESRLVDKVPNTPPSSKPLSERKVESIVEPVSVSITTPDKEVLHSPIVRAGPSGRRLARELGINIADLAQEMPGSRISKDDIKAYAKRFLQSGGAVGSSSAPQNNAPRVLPDLSRFGETRAEKLTKIATTTSANMTDAWSTIPHAWLQEKIDITELEEWRQEQKSNDVHLSITAIIAKAIAVAAKDFPKMNSSFDQQNDSLIFKNYYDVGIAVDTPHGLVVPSVRHVDRKRLAELSNDIRDLSQRAINRKLTSNDLQGAGITLSNLGGIGLSSIFPIINWPQVAIVGAAGTELVAKVVGGQLVERQIITLTLGFDHRVINGAEGARFLVCIKGLLEDIRRLII